MSNVQQENCSLERGPGVDSFELLPSQKDPKGKNVICVICLLISLQVFLVSFEGCIYVGYIYIQGFFPNAINSEYGLPMQVPHGWEGIS